MYKYKPSNGTEGDHFISEWCGTCKKDNISNGTVSLEDESDNDTCNILGKTMCLDVEDDDYPEEWAYRNNNPCCTAYDALTLCCYCNKNLSDDEVKYYVNSCNDCETKKHNEFQKSMDAESEHSNTET